MSAAADRERPDRDRDVRTDTGQSASERFDPTTTEAFVETAVTRFVLIRHGAVDEQRRRVVRGQLDLPTSACGREQAQRVARWLGRHEPAPARLFTSDLLRCRELAEPCAAAWGVEPIPAPELREQSMGAWQGLTWEEVQRRYGTAINDYWDDYVNARPPGGESLADLDARVGAFLERIATDHAGERLVLVTHIGPIRCLVCRLFGLGLDQALRFAPAAGSVTQVLHSAPGAVLETFGERPWRFE